MFDDLGPGFGWLDRLIHFFLCNNALLPGCSGHRERNPQ